MVCEKDDANKVRKMLKKNSKLCISEKNDEAVLLNMESGMFFGLQDVSYDIWKIIGKCCDVDSIVNEIVQIYDVSRKEAEIDVSNIINEMKENGLVIEE